MAYATVADLEARWPEKTFTLDEEAAAGVLLDDAAVYLDSLVTVDSSDSHQADVLRIVSCSMVRRAMVASSSSALGVDEMSATMGAFSQTQHFSNPSGDMYLTGNERSLLGIGSGYIGTLPAGIEGFYGSNA